LKYLLIFGALAIVLIAGALLLLERRIRVRTRRVLAAQEPVAGEPVLELRIAVATAFADGMPAPLDQGEVEVVCTASVLAAGRLVIPLAAVEDAAIERGALRVRWSGGGEKLVTSLTAPVHDLERLRREIHLRQPNVIEKLLSMVQK
jgi:hypothetical protein